MQFRFIEENLINYLLISEYEGDDGWKVSMAIEPDRESYYSIEAEKSSTRAYVTLYLDDDIYDEYFGVNHADNMSGTREVNEKIQELQELLEVRDAMVEQLVPIAKQRIAEHALQR